VIAFMSSIRPMIPLLLAAGILLGGNGLQSTLIALRGAQEGFSASDIGLMGTFYFAGFLLGCLAITRIMKAVGHIRAFSALAAIASAGTLLLVLVLDPVMWCAVRFAGGFCFAGLFTIVESWLNSGVANKDRARVLAIYRMVDTGSVTGAQFLIPVFGAGGFTIFAIMSIMITLSLVPVSLGDRTNPTPPEDVKLDLARVWRISPLGCFGCIAVGVTNSAFRTLSPVYAEQIGMSVADVVTFVSFGIFGGAIIQYPLGYLSDRWDRRRVLLITTCCAMVSALALVFIAGSNPFRHAALFAVGRALQRPRRHGRVRADQCGLDAVLFLRRHWRAVRRLDGDAVFRAERAVRVQRRRLCDLHRRHPLPDAGPVRRAGRQAQPLHCAVAHLDGFRTAGQEKQRFRRAHGVVTMVPKLDESPAG
jgi:MFS family permease